MFQIARRSDRCGLRETNAGGVIAGDRAYRAHTASTHRLRPIYGRLPL